MSTTIGKIVVGGGAIFFSYRLSNSLIETCTQKNRYSIKDINERLKSKPKDIELNRKSLIEQTCKETFDVVIVGDRLEVSQVALDCSFSKLKTLLIYKEDFNSELKDQVLMEKDIGSYAMLKNIPSRTNSLKDIYDFYCSIGSEYSHLNTAPYLSIPMKTIIYFPCIFSSIIGYLKHKLSDIIVNKPPKYCAKFNSFVPPWYSESSAVGGVEVNQISLDNERMNLVTILTAASFGAIPLNYVEVLNIENENQQMVISMKDKMSDNVFKSRSKKIISTKEKECNENSSIHCFHLAQNPLDKNVNCCFTEEEILIQKNLNLNCFEACVASTSDHREAFQKVKNVISRFKILRKGEVKSIEKFSGKTPFLWEVISANGIQTLCSNSNPVTMKRVNSDILLLGSHGWHPELSTVIANKYALPMDLCDYLVRKYGDLSLDLAMKVTMTKCELQENALLEVETIQGCKEMCLTVLDMCKRLNISDENDINFVAGIMQKHLKWTRKDTENQVIGAKIWINSLKVKEDWKSCLTSNAFEVEPGFLKEQQNFFERNVRESKVLHQWQMEQHLKSSDSFLNEDLVDVALRNADLEKNGELSEEEFLAIMKLLYVKTPKEVIEKHIKNIKKDI